MPKRSRTQEASSSWYPCSRLYKPWSIEEGVFGLEVCGDSQSLVRSLRNGTYRYALRVIRNLG
jgi:hypothetical protein